MRFTENIIERPLVVTAVLAGHIALFLSLPVSPLLDLPNHIVRCWAIKEQLIGHQVGFVFDFMFIPYICGDLLLAAVLSIMSWQAAEMLWTVVCYLAMPLGVWAYLKSRNADAGTSKLIMLFAAYASANWFFLSGFANFCLGIGLAFSAAASWERLYREGDRAKAYSNAVCIGLVLACYLTHLAAFLFAGIMIGAVTVARVLGGRESFISALCSALPFALILAAHVMLQPDAPDMASVWQHRALWEKPLAVGAMYIRYNQAVDSILFATLALGILTLAAWPTKSKQPLDLVQLGEDITVLIALTAAYLVLPVKAAPAYGVDSRALPFMSVSAMLIAAAFIKSRGELRLRRANFLLSSIAVVSLLYLVPFMRAHSNFVAAVDQAWRSIPPGERVLPVATVPDIGRIQPSLHRPELYAIENPGFVPYVFSRDTSGSQIEYFHYRYRYPYAPHIKWYLNNEQIRWDELSPIYSFILITKPYEPERLAELNYRLVYENDAAAVLKLEQGSAGSGSTAAAS
ncbi:MAG: hypothetical protein KDD66_06600 [Bdellovibrionales bacterium]|nr:hypothetical protein [Bdellovibrionales bacterium]